jgi:hypothetical protein
MPALSSTRPQPYFVCLSIGPSEQWLAAKSRQMLMTGKREPLEGIATATHLNR